MTIAGAGLLRSGLAALETELARGHKMTIAGAGLLRSGLAALETALARGHNGHRRSWTIAFGPGGLGNCVSQLVSGVLTSSRPHVLT